MTNDSESQEWDDQWEVIMETAWTETEHGSVMRKVTALIYIPAGQGADTAIKVASAEAGVDLSKISNLFCKTTGGKRAPSQIK